MLSPAEQAIYDQLTMKFNTPAPAPYILPPVPVPQPVQQASTMDAINKYIDQVVEQKIADFQSKMIQAPIEKTTLDTHADFLSSMQKTIMNGLTLMQTGRFFQLAVAAGNKKEELFKNAIISFCQTKEGVDSIQMFADSLIKAIDGAGKEAK